MLKPALTRASSSARERGLWLAGLGMRTVGSCSSVGAGAFAPARDTKMEDLDGFSGAAGENRPLPGLENREA